MLIFRRKKHGSLWPLPQHTVGALRKMFTSR